MADTPLSSYPIRTLTHVLGHDASDLVGKLAVSGLGGGSTVIAQDDPPSTITTPVNSLWYETDVGLLYILIDDGSSVQWVAVGDAVSGDVLGPPSVAATDRIAVFDGTTGKLLKDGGFTIDELPSGGSAPGVSPQIRLTFDAAIHGTMNFGDTVIANEFDEPYIYTGPAPTGYESIGPSFYTVATPSTNVDNHSASYNGVSGTVYSTSTTVTCNLVGGNFTAYRSGGSTNPIMGVVGTAVLGDAAIGSFGGDGGVGGYFNTWANNSSVSNANGTEAFEINGNTVAGTVIGAYARSYVTTTYALNTGVSIGVLGISTVETNAANSIGGWFGAKNREAIVGDVGNRFGVLIDDISGAKNLNMALRTGLGAVQFGGKVTAATGFAGNLTLAQIGTTTISSVHGGAFGKYSYTDTGTKTYTYKVVPVFASGVTGPASAAVSTAFGFDNLATDDQNNLVTFNPVEGAVGGYDIYRTVAGGTTTNTTGKIGNCPQQITRSVNGNAIEPTTPSFVDVGQVGDGSTPPAVDTTGTVTATKFVGANFTSSAQGLTPASGGGTANFLRADGTWAAAGGGGGTPAGSGTEIQYRNGSSFGAMAGTTWDDTNRSLTMAGATVTTDKPVLDLSQTWNAGGVAFTGIKANYTNTASANGSKLLDLQVGGSSKLAFGVVQSGSQYLLSLSGGFTASDLALRGMFGTITCMNGTASTTCDFQASNITAATIIGTTGIYLNSSTARVQFGSGGDPTLTRQGANILGLSNGASATTFNVYNSTDDNAAPTTYSRIAVKWVSNIGYIVPEASGTLLPLIISTGTMLVGSLPTPTAALAGARAMVTDTTANTFGAALAGTGGGTNKHGAICDGAIWKIG